jgi:hypothetical protein
VVEIVQVGDAQVVHVVLNGLLLILEPGVPDIHGIKIAADVLCHMKVEEMLMLCSSILMELLMSDSGKLIVSTGMLVMEEIHHVLLNLILIVPLKSINGVEIPGNSGAHIQPVDVDMIH